MDINTFYSGETNSFRDSQAQLRETACKYMHTINIKKLKKIF